MSDAALLLVALLQMYHPPAPIRARMEAHREQIVVDADAASATTGVPSGLLLAVAFAESHLGQEFDSGGSWGSPTDRLHRHRAGGAFHAARDLMFNYRTCGGTSWLRAVRQYRSGSCDHEPRRGYSAGRALWIARRLYERAGLAVPEGLEDRRWRARRR